MCVAGESGQPPTQGRIIVLTGASSSGKSTSAAAGDDILVEHIIEFAFW